MTTAYEASLSTEERKRRGVFYTPEAVVRYLLRATAPVGAVADLSCGDGAFLRAAAAAGLGVMGIEQDAAALAKARAALGPKAWLHQGDGLTTSLPDLPDVVLGNPPYLEAKTTDPALKAACRKRFPTIARGSFDVFVCFLQAGLEALPPGGRLGYIVPNKCLVAQYARPLRELLLETCMVEEVVDVSDLPTFRDAAVYPVLLVVRKAPPPSGHRVRTGVVSDLAQLESGDFPRAEIPQAQWRRTAHRVFWLPPTDRIGRGLVERVMADPETVPLAELLDIRWTVSFHRAGLRDGFIFPEARGRNPRPLLGGTRFQGNGDVRRYRLAWSGWWIDYDEDRARAAGNPLPPGTLFDGEKLVIAQNARRVIATLDRADHVCKDTFLAGRRRPDAPDHRYLLALLNSRLLSYIYGVLFKATHVNGAYLHYLACYLGDLPIRRAADLEPFHRLVDALLDPATLEDRRQELDTELDAWVYALYGLTPEERTLVDAAVPYAWGEPTGSVKRGRPKRA